MRDVGKALAPSPRMADGMYIGMAGAAARSAQLDAVADNLANVRTPGFKAARPSFEAFLPAEGGSTQVFPAAVSTGFDLRPGQAERTAAPLDVYPEEGAFISVRLPTGETGYTRNGHMEVDAQGTLHIGGNPVLQANGQPISVPPDLVPRVAEDGTIHVNEDQVAELGLFKLEGTLERVGNASLIPVEGQGRAVGVEARVRVGELELSNATPMEAAVALVNVQRHFDSSMQAIQTYRRMDERASEVGRVR